MAQELDDRREAQLLLESLREHGRVIDADHEDVHLPPGVTHVLVRDPAGKPARLVEKRKSFF
jgi:hypothetical protein